eukprot:7387725-Prymnesium_polylepis.2
MRRISTEIVEGVAHRAASMLVDDSTKRGLPELLVSRVTEGAIGTDEVTRPPSICCGPGV